MAAFELSKWYLDCTADCGDASIIYSGRMNWGPVRLDYSSRLESTGQSVRVAHSLRRQTEPGVDAGGVLRFGGGEWRAESREIRETVYASEAGSVEWCCVMPRALARVGDHRSGLGYAEHLRMTIPPWKLPMRTLRWGRFLGESSGYIVWIDWLGGVYSRRIVYRDGELAEAADIEDGMIQFADGARLTLDRSLVLREGRLGSTVLSAIPGFRDSFPSRLAQIEECKWRSRGRLASPGLPAVEGWAIHERVDWPE